MPSVQSSWSISSQSSPGIRLGAGIAVIALHLAVVAAIYSAREVKPQLPEAEAIMVSVVEAPQPQVAKADPVPQPPQPPVEQPPPPPPEPEVQPDPDPAPDVKPDPDPEPVIEHPPVPAPKPKPKPRPLPKPQTPPAKPVDTPPPPPPPAVAASAPEGAATPQAPRQGPPHDQPDLVSNIEYQGEGPRLVYPLASKRMNEEGRVMVLAVINTQGLVDKVTVVSSSGYPRLDDAALDAVRQVRFKPYTRNGVAYPVQARIPCVFNLRN